MRGANVVDGPEEFFLRRFKIDEDIRNKNATIELHLTSIDLLVAVRVDAVNKIINNTTTSYLPGNVARNETEPEKETKKGQITTNHHKNTDTSLPPPKTPEANSFISTLSELAWNGLCYAMQAFYDWLTFGFGGPRHINVDRFMARSITRADITWSAKGTADHMFNLDIAEMEKGIHRLNTLIPLMTMTDMGHSDSKHLPKFSTFDYFRSNPEILWDSPLQRENEDSMLPSNLDTLALLDQKCPVEDEDDYIHWPEPETPAEFATTEPEKENEKEQIVTTHLNKTGISLPSSETNRVNSSTLLEIEWNGLPPPETPRVNSSTLTEMAWNSLSCVMQSFYDWLTFGIGGLRHINVNRFSARSITWSVEESADHIFNLSNAENEKEFSRVGTLIPPMTKTDMGRSDSQQLPKFSTFDYFRSNPEILWVSPLQRKNEDSIFTDNVDAVDLKDETPAEFHPETEFCTKKADTTWFTTRLWNRSVAAMRWLRSNETQKKACNLTTKDIMWRDSLVEEESPSKRNGESWLLKNSQIGNPVLMDESNTSTPAEAEIQSNGTVSNVCIKDHEIIYLGINDMAPLIFHTRDDIRLEATPVKKANNKGMEKIFINKSDVCLVGSKKNSLDTNYCSWNASRRSPESSWFTTRLWNKCMGIIGWRKSSGVPVQATRVNKGAQDKWKTQEPVNVFEICMAASNKSHPETEFCTKKADTTWFTTRLWNRGVAAVRWLRSNETQENARNLTKCYWTRLQITIINWKWQVMFYVMVILIIWTTDYYFMALYLTIQHIKDIVRLIRLQREIQKRDLEEERERLNQLAVEHEQAAQSSTLQREIQERERLPQLVVEHEQVAQSSTLQREIQECERLPQLVVEHEQAAQSKPWKPKPRKKKRPNYCGRQQKW